MDSTAALDENDHVDEAPPSRTLLQLLDAALDNSEPNAADDIDEDVHANDTGESFSINGTSELTHVADSDDSLASDEASGGTLVDGQTSQPSTAANSPDQIFGQVIG